MCITAWQGTEREKLLRAPSVPANSTQNHWDKPGHPLIPTSQIDGRAAYSGLPLVWSVIWLLQCYTPTPHTTPVTAASNAGKAHSYACKSKASALPVPPASCRLGRACAVFHFLLVAVDRVAAARTPVHINCYSQLQCFVSDQTLAKSSQVKF